MEKTLALLEQTVNNLHTRINITTPIGVMGIRLIDADSCIKLVQNKLNAQGYNNLFNWYNSGLCFTIVIDDMNVDIISITCGLLDNTLVMFYNSLLDIPLIDVNNIVRIILNTLDILPDINIAQIVTGIELIIEPIDTINII